MQIERILLKNYAIFTPEKKQAAQEKGTITDDAVDLDPDLREKSKHKNQEQNTKNNSNSEDLENQKNSNIYEFNAKRKANLPKNLVKVLV